jgi:hypothetical protein
MEGHYSIGDAMTYEEMVKSKKGEKRCELYNPFENSLEKNPYLFEDTPVGVRRFAVLNIVGKKFEQKHEKCDCMIKVKVSTVSCEQAYRISESIQEKEGKYALYVVEMFKFVCLPPPVAGEEEGGDFEIDDIINNSIRMEYLLLDDLSNEFSERKNAMMSELERHNEISKKIANGELEEKDSESAPLFPEEVKERENTEISEISESMEPDVQLCSDKYVVLATLKITKDEKMKDSVILKICGTFDDESKANSHMKELKKDMKYKIFDVSVCDMYAWLELPPPYELIENVYFDSEKLTEALGVRKKVINVDQTGLQCPELE